MASEAAQRSRGTAPDRPTCDEAIRQAIQDQVGGVVESIEQLRADKREVSRTMSGRSRLLEERFGKMIEAVGSELDTQLGDLTRRVEALENKSEPAA